MRLTEMAESNGSFFLYIFNRGLVLFCAAFSVLCFYETFSLFLYFEIKEWMILLTTSACCVFDWCGLFCHFLGVKRLLVHVLFISTVLKPMLRFVTQRKGKQAALRCIEK